MIRILLRHSPIAQLVEQMTVNHWVTGSSPVRGAIFQDNYLIVSLENVIVSPEMWELKH